MDPWKLLLLLVGPRLRMGRMRRWKSFGHRLSQAKCCTNAVVVVACDDDDDGECFGDGDDVVVVVVAGDGHYCSKYVHRNRCSEDYWPSNRLQSLHWHYSLPHHLTFHTSQTNYRTDLTAVVVVVVEIEPQHLVDLFAYAC